MLKGEGGWDQLPACSHAAAHSGVCAWGGRHPGVCPTRLLRCLLHRLHVASPLMLPAHSTSPHPPTHPHAQSWTASCSRTPPPTEPLPTPPPAERCAWRRLRRRFLGRGGPAALRLAAWLLLPACRLAAAAVVTRRLLQPTLLLLPCRSIHPSTQHKQAVITTRILQLVHELCTKRIHVTKRDLFYTGASRGGAGQGAAGGRYGWLWVGMWHAAAHAVRPACLPPHASARRTGACEAGKTSRLVLTTLPCPALPHRRREAV